MSRSVPWSHVSVRLALPVDNDKILVSYKNSNWQSLKDPKTVLVGTIEWKLQERLEIICRNLLEWWWCIETYTVLLESVLRNRTKNMPNFKFVKKFNKSFMGHSALLETMSK